MMEMEYLREIPHTQIDRRPRKRPRIATWDPPQSSQIRFCGRLENVRSVVISLEIFNNDQLFVNPLNLCLVSRYFRSGPRMVDREMREMVAVKIIRSIKKYRDAAMIEIDVLEQLGKHNQHSNGCVQIRNWFDYRNHICIVFEMLGPSLFDFLRKNNYRSFPVDLVREIGRQLLECVAFMHDLQLVHTDLKPENILFISSEYVKIPDNKGTFREGKRLPKSSVIKVIDFGSTAHGTQSHN